MSRATGQIWISDSETSSLRYLDHSGRISTTVGTGLFDFGYKDGPADHALLQHPLGVIATPHGIVVCDTYNSALRRYDAQKNELTTLARKNLSEPSGATLLNGSGGQLVVADTNNHRLARVGLDGDIHPFEVRGLMPPAPIPGRGPVEIGPVELELTATLPIPDGQKLDSSHYKLNYGRPHRRCTAYEPQSWSGLDLLGLLRRTSVFMSGGIRHKSY